MNLKEARNLVNYYNELIERQSMLQEALASLENFESVAFGGVPRFYSGHPDYSIIYTTNKDILTRRLELITQEIAQLEVTDEKET